MAHLTQADLGAYREPNYEDYQAVVTASKGLARSTLSRIKRVGRWVMPFPEKAPMDSKPVTVTHSTSSKPSSAEYHSDQSTISEHDSMSLSVDSDDEEAFDLTQSPKPSPATDGLDEVFLNTVELTDAQRTDNQLQNVYRLIAHICNHPVGEKIDMRRLVYILELNPDRIDSIMRFMFVLVHAHPELAQDLLNQLGYTEDQIVNGDVLLDACDSTKSHELQNALWNKLEMHFRQIHNAKCLLQFIYYSKVFQGIEAIGEKLPYKWDIHEAPQDHMSRMLWLVHAQNTPAAISLQEQLLSVGSYEQIVSGEILLMPLQEALDRNAD